MNIPKLDNKQKCTQCTEDSIPGLVWGQGLCQYHWAVRVWGVAWANKSREIAWANKRRETKEMRNDK